MQDIRYEDLQSLKQWIRSRTSNIYNKKDMYEHIHHEIIEIDKTTLGHFITIPNADEIYLGRVSGSFFRKNGTKALRTKLNIGEPYPEFFITFGEERIDIDIPRRISPNVTEIVLEFPIPLEGQLEIEIHLILVKN